MLAPHPNQKDNRQHYAPTVQSVRFALPEHGKVVGRKWDSGVDRELKKKNKKNNHIENHRQINK